MASATYTLLKDGTWGIKSKDLLANGQKVQVEKKSGEIKTETVACAVSGGIFRIAPSAMPAKPSTGAFRGKTSSRPSYSFASHRAKKLHLDLEDGCLKPYSQCDMPA